MQFMTSLTPLNVRLESPSTTRPSSEPRVEATAGHNSQTYSRSVVQALAFRTWRARMIRSAIAPSLDSSAGT